MIKKNILLIITFAVLLTGCITATTQPPPPAQPQNGIINWNDANSYVGEFKTVCGPVVDSNYASSTSGSPTFLNIGKKYPEPGRFTVLIWGRYRNKFTQSPEKYYLGKTICVNGLIEEYRGIPEIEVDDPAQIEIR